MSLQPVEPRRLYRQIADQLRARVRDGHWQAGERLPAERELAGLLGVSRPSVREALIALEVEGVLEVRMGSGIYVAARGAEAAARPPHTAAEVFGPFEILRARGLIEGELAAWAARQMTPARLDGLHDALERMRQAVAQGLPPVAGDRLFHLRVAEAADNGPLLRQVGTLFDERHNPLFQRLGRHFENPPSWCQAVAEHARVLEAIAAGDADGARQAMQRHLQAAHDRFAAAWPAADARGGPPAFSAPPGRTPDTAP